MSSHRDEANKELERRRELRQKREAQRRKAEQERRNMMIRLALAGVVLLGVAITIIAFADDERVDIQVFTATSDFDPNLPMTVYKGYYIRGYKMPQES